MCWPRSIDFGLSSQNLLLISPPNPWMCETKSPQWLFENMKPSVTEVTFYINVRNYTLYLIPSLRHFCFPTLLAYFHFKPLYTFTTFLLHSHDQGLKYKTYKLIQYDDSLLQTETPIKIVKSSYASIGTTLKCYTVIHQK